MPDELTRVRIGGAHDLPAAMMFLAALAYPEDWQKRDEAVMAMRAALFRIAIRRGRPVPDVARDELRALPTQQMHGRLSRLSERLAWRLEAAHVAWRLMTGFRREGTHVRIEPREQQSTRAWLRARGLPDSEAIARTATTREVRPGRAYSLNDYARRASVGEARWKNTRWDTSVMHLALALHGRRIAWRDPRGFTVLALLFNPDWVQRALESAETYAAVWPRANLRTPLRGLRSGTRVRLIPHLEKAEPAVG